MAAMFVATFRMPRQTCANPNCEPGATLRLGKGDVAYVTLTRIAWALPAVHRQAFLTTKPLSTWDVQALIAEPPAPQRQFAQTRQAPITSLARTVPCALAIRPDNHTCPPFDHSQCRSKVRERFPLRVGRHHLVQRQILINVLSDVVSADIR